MSRPKVQDGIREGDVSPVLTGEGNPPRIPSSDYCQCGNEADLALGENPICFDCLHRHLEAVRP